MHGRIWLVAVALFAALSLAPTAQAADPVFQSVNCFNTAGADGCAKEGVQNFSSGAVASPDGAQIYSMSSGGNGAIVQYDRDGQTNTLTRHAGKAGCLVDIGVSTTCNTAAGLGGPFAMAFSLDGSRAYVAGYFGTVAVLKRDQATGELSALGGDGTCFDVDGAPNCTTMPALVNVTGIAMAPDGKNVYVTTDETDDATSADGSLIVFNQIADGALALHSPNPCFNADGVNGCSKLAVGAVASSGNPVVTPTRVYTGMGSDPGGIAVFTRDATGGLSQSATHACLSAGTHTGCDTGNSHLAGAFSLVQSPDGKQLYVGGYDAVLGYTVGGDGALSLVNCISDTGTAGCENGVGLGFVYGLAMGSDGNDLAAGITEFSGHPGGITFLRRDAATGKLSQLDNKRGCISNDGTAGECQTNTALGGNDIPTGVPNAHAFYSGGSKTGLIAGFRRNTPPTCQTANVSTAFNTPVNLTLSCSDPDGTPVTLSVSAQPRAGTLGAFNGSSITYTPFATFSGTDSFTFQALSDGQTSDPAVASASVAAAPPPAPTPTPTPVTPAAPSLALTPVRPTWLLAGIWTKVSALVVAKIPAGATVTVTCTPKGKTSKAKRSCAFKKSTKKFPKAVKSADFAKLFKQREMIPGTKVELRITKVGSIGKSVVYKIGKTKKSPPATVKCIAVGTTKLSTCAP